MTYKVKRGDTLLKVATRHGITLAQLLEANPRFKANPNKVRAGELLTLPNGEPEAITLRFPSTTSTSRTTTAAGSLGRAASETLGALSAKYETGGRGPGTVSTGSGDPGGVSYGSYQMATKTGTAARFVSQHDFPWRTEFKNLKPGSAQFTAKWKEIAATETAAFQESQHSFIKKTHYDLLAAKILNQDELDVNRRSRTLQDVIWSTAVQHGGNASIVHKALATLNLTPDSHDFDKKLISAIYAERGRKGANGKLVYFSGSSPDVQVGVAKRFKGEESDALKMLANET